MKRSTRKVFGTIFVTDSTYLDFIEYFFDGDDAWTLCALTEGEYAFYPVAWISNAIH